MGVGALSSPPPSGGSTLQFGAGGASSRGVVGEEAPAVAAEGEREPHLKCRDAAQGSCLDTSIRNSGGTPEAPPPNGAETPTLAEARGFKGAEDKPGATRLEGADGEVLGGEAAKTYSGRIQSMLPPALADLSEEARRHAEKVAAAAAAATAAASEHGVSAAVQSAMGAIATAHASGGASALGTLASSRGRIDIDMDAPRVDARPDRLKLVGSAAFQVCGGASYAVKWRACTRAALLKATLPSHTHTSTHTPSVSLAPSLALTRTHGLSRRSAWRCSSKRATCKPPPLQRPLPLPRPAQRRPQQVPPTSHIGNENLNHVEYLFTRMVRRQSRARPSTPVRAVDPPAPTRTIPHARTPTRSCRSAR